MRFRHLLPFILVLLALSCTTPPPVQPVSTPSPSVAPTPSPEPSASPTPVPTPSPEPSPSPQISPEPKASATPVPQASPVVKVEIRPILKQIRVTYPDGFLSGTNEYAYDAVGRLVSDTEKNGSDIMVSLRTYTYKPDGSLEIFSFDGDRKLKSKSIQYFENDHIVKELVLSDKDEPQSTSEYKYNEAGQKILWTIQGKGAAPTSSEYVWTNDRLTLITVLDTAKNPIKKYKRTYSADGNIITEEEQDGKGALIRKTISTWASGKLLKEESRTAADAVQKSSAYRYDAKGLLVKTELFNRKGELIEIQNRVWTDLTITSPAK